MVAGDLARSSVLQGHGNIATAADDRAPDGQTLGYIFLRVGTDSDTVLSCCSMRLACPCGEIGS